MNVLRLFKSEILKQKRSLIWALVLLIPLGTTAAMYLYMRFRDYNWFLIMVQKKNYSLWQALILENHFNVGWGRFVPLFIAVISVIIYYTEFKEDSWKKLLSLPVRKGTVYSLKLIVILFFTFIMICLNSLGLILVGKLIGFTQPIDLLLYGKYILYQSCAVLGVTTFHNWLSSYFKNPLLSLFTSIGGIIFCAIFFNYSPDIGAYFPYNYHFFVATNEGPDPLIGVYGGIISGIIIYLLGYFEFKQRDIV